MQQGYIWDHWAGSLRLLSQVEHLVLEVEFVPVSEKLQVSPMPQDFFTCMNLKVIFSIRFNQLEICMPEAPSRAGIYIQESEVAGANLQHSRKNIEYISRVW